MACNQGENLVECHTCVVYMLAMLNVVTICPSIVRTGEMCGDAQPAKKKMINHNARMQTTKPRTKKLISNKNEQDKIHKNENN